MQSALTILERVNEEIYIDENESPPEVRKILMPVDFSEFSLQTCSLGLNLAAKTQNEVVFYHTYFNPVTNTLPFSEAFTYEKKLTETLRELEDNAREDMNKFVDTLKNEMKHGRLPDVKFSTELVEGIPEERIIQYAKKHRPKVIVMGTRGKNRKVDDLIGSVTAEVIDRAKVPVLAIPEDAPINTLDEVQNIAYATNFDKTDFEALDKLMEMLQDFKVNIFCLHVGQKDEDVWNSVKLEGMKKYLEDKYRDVTFSCKLVEGSDILLGIEKEVQALKIDAIALTTHRRNIIARLFNPSIARKMLFHTNTPLLVFHA